MSNYNMDCNKQYTIKVTDGNEFDLVLRLKSRTFKSSKPIDEDIDATKLEDLVVKINNEEWDDVRTDESGVICHIPADLPVGTYNVELTATYNGVAIRAAYFECFARPNWSYMSDAENYLPGSPIESEAAYIIGGPLTDEEVEELKAELRLKIAAAEEAKEAYDAAKEAYIEKAEELDGVAQEETSQEILTAVDNIDIDTTTIAKQGTNANATLTITQAAVVDGNDTAVGVGKEVRSEVGTGSDTAAETGTLFAIVKWIKNKVNAITGYALQGSDSTKSITTLDASLGDVEDALDYMEQHIMPEYSNLAKQGSNANANISDIQEKIGTPASGQPSDLFAAIAAGGGGGGETITYPTVQMTDTTASIDPNKVYIWGEVASLTISALNAGQSGVANVYFLEFYSGSTATTLTLPASVTDVRGTVGVNKIINVGIFNNVAYIA